VRRIIKATVAVIGGLAVAACTSSPPSALTPSASATRSAQAPGPAIATPSPSPSPPPPPANPSPTIYPRLPIPAGTPRCHTSQVEVGFTSNGAAAGNVEYTFEMRNHSVVACWVYGFVGFQAVNAKGHPFPETIRWTTESFFGRSDQPSRILLPVGTAALGSGQGPGHAFFNVATNDVLCDTTQDPVASLEIWPPDEYQSLRIGAQTPSGSPFVFCTYIALNPLQVQPAPSLE
jgi:uncharacterized protein DUF4232